MLWICYGNYIYIIFKIDAVPLFAGIHWNFEKVRSTKIQTQSTKNDAILKKAVVFKGLLSGWKQKSVSFWFRIQKFDAITASEIINFHHFESDQEIKNFSWQIYSKVPQVFFKYINSRYNEAEFPPPPSFLKMWALC